MCREEGKPGLGRPWRGEDRDSLAPWGSSPQVQKLFVLRPSLEPSRLPVKWRIEEMFPSQASLLPMTVSWRPQHTYRNLALLLGSSGL